MNTVAWKLGSIRAMSTGVVVVSILRVWAAVAAILSPRKLSIAGMHVVRPAAQIDAHCYLEGESLVKL